MNDNQTLLEQYSNSSCLELTQDFADISSGLIQVPRTKTIPNDNFSAQSNEVRFYCDTYVRNMGDFWKHYCASIPFIMEEQCRIGIALSRLTKNRKISNPLTYYETGSQDGTHARTIAEIACGRILTLTDGLHLVNEKNFEKLCPHNFSKFFAGHFCELTPELIHRTPFLSAFSSGFDFVYENATFQFYGINRYEQIAHVKRLMKENGILICLEKLLQNDPQEYQRREEIKDRNFKTKYFTEDEIQWKKNKILSSMNYQVKFNFLISALKKHFSYIYLLWNSTNFYEIIACNSHIHLEDFFACLPSMYVPEEFQFEGNLSKPKRVL